MKKLLLLLSLTASVLFADEPPAPEITVYTINTGLYNSPGGDGTLQQSSLGPASDPLNGYRAPFMTWHNGWRLWKWGVYPGAVSVTNPESGKIDFQFTGGGGGSNRGDLLLFWLQEQVERPTIAYVYTAYNFNDPWYDSENGLFVDQKTAWPGPSSKFASEAEARAWILTLERTPPGFGDPGFSGPGNFEGMTATIQIIPGGEKRWVIVHAASTPNEVGNPSSPMGANYQGSGSFTYDASVYGGSRVIVEKYNLQRTSGDDNRVQYDYYEFAEVLGVSNAPPVVLIRGSNGQAPLNP